VCSIITQAVDIETSLYEGNLAASDRPCLEFPIVDEEWSDMEPRQRQMAAGSIKLALRIRAMGWFPHQHKTDAFRFEPQSTPVDHITDDVKAEAAAIQLDLDAVAGRPSHNGTIEVKRDIRGLGQDTADPNNRM
jgi:hypothetical protein